ncbi:MAG: hypothetical protein WCW40_11010 [Bacteroidota bacterium]
MKIQLKCWRTLLLGAALFSVPEITRSQVPEHIQKYRSEDRGNAQHRKEGVMDGNLIRTLYDNVGQVGNWPNQPSGEWPKGSGHSYLDGVAVIVGARFNYNGKIITPMETMYREWMDRDPATQTLWGFEPVQGYVNPAATHPAQNRDTASFPSKWSRSLFSELNYTEAEAAKWDGYWYGYFGRGVTNADFETFYVMDDAQDREYNRAPFGYWPIVDTVQTKSTVTGNDTTLITVDSTRGGLGLRVEVRGFQWSHVLAEDIIFWHYDIINLANSDYDNAVFGFYTDPGVGGTEAQTNSALFDSKLDLTYAWNQSGIGTPGNWKTGYVGYAYLESPGISGNGKDDDEDGMTDEKRNDGIDNDKDWRKFTDLNNNSTWEIDEPLNDDVGADGVGPFDQQYQGKDKGEGDGLPTTGEPNFDRTDKDESDQIGLTAIAVLPLDPSGKNFNDDVLLYKRMTSGFSDTVVQNSNISIYFSSGPFPLKRFQRERFSMALALGSDLNDLIFNKNTVQAIYNANYNFSQPPYTPHLTAVAGDKKVYLYWDNIAEQSYDKFLYKKDFEGYSIYRSTEPEFEEVKVITDMDGEPKYWRPLARFDLVDSISGSDPVGINGAHFNRGSNTGLRHSFVDSTVENGMKYYYALVSYDQGDPHYGTTGLQPAECPKIISVDYAGNLKFVDINCAVVTPNAASSGYVPPGVDGNVSSVKAGIGTGSIRLQVVDPLSIRNDARYRVVLHMSDTIPYYKTSTLDVIRTEKTVSDTVVKKQPVSSITGANYSTPFDGLILGVSNDSVAAVIDTATGWMIGHSNLTLKVMQDNSNAALNLLWPSDYEIRFLGSDSVFTAFDAPPEYPKMKVPFVVTNTTQGKEIRCIVHDIDGNGKLSVNDSIRFIEAFKDESSFKITWSLSYGAPSSGAPALPQAGDKFVVKTRKPFYEGDYFEFTTRGQRVDAGLAKASLNNIKVVPNPYIGTAKWETRTLYQSGRGERKIAFIHLPQECTVRIYTMAGVLVKTLTKSSPIHDGSLEWNLVTEDGMDIAFGMYIYHVDAPGIGEHIGKFAVIK